jgi:hypothetical protein
VAGAGCSAGLDLNGGTQCSIWENWLGPEGVHLYTNSVIFIFLVLFLDSAPPKMDHCDFALKKSQGCSQGGNPQGFFLITLRVFDPPKIIYHPEGKPPSECENVQSV